MGRNRPLIVHNVEDYRRLEDTGEIQAVMEITLGTGAISEPSDGGLVIALVGAGHSYPYRLTELGADRAGYGNEMSFTPRVVHWHLPAADIVLDIADTVADHADHVPAPNELRTGLAIGGEDPVLLIQRHGLGDGDCLFTQ